MSPDPFQERRQRIIKHVNHDHKPELTRYLQHFAGLPYHVASSAPELRDVSFECMLIRVGGDQEHSVPFDPPLSSWDDIRSRLVEMDASAKKSLGRQDDKVTITEYTPPWGLDLPSAIGVCFWFFCYTYRSAVVPGSTPWNIAQKVFPGGAEWFLWVVNALFWPVILVHFGEMVVFERTRLTKANVERGSGLWFAWVATCFLEGYPSMKRFDRLVAAKRKNAKSQ